MKSRSIAGIISIVGSLLGSTTVATVSAPTTLPIGGIVAAGALLTYGGYQAYKLLHKKP